MTPREPRPLCAPGVHEAALALLLRHLPPPARIVDLGTGEGALALRLARAGYEVRAVDRDPAPFCAAGIPMTVQDLAEPFAAPLGPGRYDGCVAVEIIEHLDSPLRFLRECRALLRPGGVLVLSSPNVESLASRLLFLWNGRLRFFTAEERHHVSPVFSWTLERGLLESAFRPLARTWNRDVVDCGRSAKARLAALASRALRPLLRGETAGEIRLVAALAL